jgi:hypothetical protein
MRDDGQAVKTTFEDHNMSRQTQKRRRDPEPTVTPDHECVELVPEIKINTSTILAAPPDADDLKAAAGSHSYAIFAQLGI